MKKRLTLLSILTIIFISVFFLFPVQIFAQPPGPPTGDPGEGFVHLSVHAGEPGEDTKFTLKFDEPLISTAIIDNIELEWFFAIFDYSGSTEDFIDLGKGMDKYMIWGTEGFVFPPDKIMINRELSEDHYFAVLEAFPGTDGGAQSIAQFPIEELSNWDIVKFSVKEEQEEEFIRTHPLTCYQVWVNEDGNFEFVFWWEYRDNNWVKIYDMSGKEVFSIDMPYGDAHFVANLPNGMYTVKTFNDDMSTPIQTFVIGK
jgi:hypothetical protein